MRVVINHLRLERPLPAAVIDSAQDACERVVAGGGTAATLVSVDPHHAVLILTFPDAETEERVKAEIGGPWTKEHVVPLLADGTDRSTGEILASA